MEIPQDNGSMPDNWRHLRLHQGMHIDGREGMIYPSNASGSLQSSKDGDTADLIRSKAAYSPSSDRHQKDDELLNIIQSNLGNVSKQLREGIVQNDSQVHDAISSDQRDRTSTSPPSNYEYDEFDFDQIEAIHDGFEADFRDRFEMDNRAFVYLASQIGLSQIKYRVGSLCQLYKAIYTLQLERLDDIRTVQQAVVDMIVKGRYRDCPYTLYVALELVYFIGGVQEDSEFVAALVRILKSRACEEIKRKAVRLLYNTSVSSLKELIRLCESNDEVLLCNTSIPP